MDNNQIQIENEIKFDPQTGLPINRPEEAKSETAATRTLKDNFMFFAPLTIAYSIFYTFCMYKNEGGITFPFFVIGSLGFLFLCVSKLGLTLKKGNIFAIISVVAISISSAFTNNADFLALNKAAIFILVICTVLKQFYDTSEWQAGKFFTAFLKQTFFSLSCIFRPFTDAFDYNHSKTKKSSKRGFYILLGILIAIPLLIIVLALLSAADVVFRETMEKIMEAIDFPTAVNIVWHIAYWFFFAYMLLAYACKHTISEKVTDKRTIEPLIATTVTSILTIVYLLFSSIQIAYLFTGSLKLPNGYTYAEYAKEGFYQLLAVSILNLVIVLVCLAFFRENTALKIILTIFSICTYVMIASAALRMIMYIRYYYLTTDRIIVLWTLAVLSILFVGVIITIFNSKFKLFDYFKVVVTILYIALTFARPEYIVAKINLAEATKSYAPEVQNSSFFLAENKYEDFEYISLLSTDAAGPIVDYLIELNYDFSDYNDWDKLTDKISYIEAARSTDEANSNEYDYGEYDDYYNSYVYYGPQIDTFGYHYMRRFTSIEKEMTIRTYNFSIANAEKAFKAANQAIH